MGDKSFLAWLIEPFVEAVQELQPPPEREVITFIKKKGDAQSKKRKKKKVAKAGAFRPTTFETYIGQTKAKEILSQYVKAITKRKAVFPHVLIYGKPGMGKSTLAKIIANMLQVPMREVMAPSLVDFKDFLPVIQDIKGGILFVDEVHGIGRSFCENLYTVMEDFTYNGEAISPFTLIGATTELGEIIKDRKPFLDRFKIIIELEDYNQDEMILIIRQYKNNVFPQDEVQNETYCIVAFNSRGTPRMAIRLFEASVYFDGNVRQVLKNFNIITEGFTYKDLKALKYIGSHKTGVGLQGLTSYLEISAENYSYVVEPYLVQKGLIIRTPRGRVLSDKGKQKIAELEAICNQ